MPVLFTHTRMATSSFSSPRSDSFSLTRMIAGLLLGAFLFFSYQIISVEVDAMQSEKLDAPPMTTPAPGIIPAASSKQVIPASEAGAFEREESAKPRAKRAREGSRREWYERRKRRWFTPPKPKLDTGLPRKRSSFKMA